MRRLLLRHERTRRTKEELQILTSRNRCLKCGLVGHWRKECPRSNLYMADAISSRQQTTGNSLQMIADTLTALFYDEDDHIEYIQDVEHTDDDNNTSLSKTMIDPYPFNSLLASLELDDASDKEKDESITHHIAFS